MRWEQEWGWELPLGPTPSGSLPTPQGAGQCVPVRGVWPGLPLSQGFTHEPGPQVLCVVSLATHCLPARLHCPARITSCQLLGQACAHAALRQAFPASLGLPSCSLQSLTSEGWSRGGVGFQGLVRGEPRCPDSFLESQIPGPDGLYRPHLYCVLTEKSG